MIDARGWLVGWEPLVEWGVMRVDMSILIVLPFVLIQLMAVVWACFRLAQALRDVRFADG